MSLRFLILLKACNETIKIVMPMMLVYLEALFLLYTNKFSDGFISNAVIYGDGTTLYFVTTTRDGFLT